MGSNCVITKKTIIDGLSNNFFVNHYQPIYNMKDNDIHGVEVLLRLKDANYNNICPECFIACAEKESMINDLFFFSANQAINDIGKNKKIKKLSINISPSTLNSPNLHLWLCATCKQYNVKNKDITLEITESVEYLETKESRENIKQLKLSGFGLSIDDFGTGFASLSRLKSIPFTELKIDRTFVKHVKNNNTDRKIIEHLVSLTHNLGLKVVAEGVEDVETYNMMKEIGVDLCQGYFFHRPMNIYNLVNNVIGDS